MKYKILSRRGFKTPRFILSSFYFFGGSSTLAELPLTPKNQMKTIHILVSRRFFSEKTNLLFQVS
jgi:hypothetical protein